ncbi:poly(U)-specific 3'-to-5' RNA exonuclease [Cladophialophora chaetospira]|uniref:U6 snRNA phosphodiesterase n=1 Tax=Cladophialophora chaetospira TaxID=386627 RepID=A0AA38XLH7_9EURO|nr:poly(U)-specific 3'-to-5' RNA exonuclease [Cladophialophora chaetospira]
MALVDYLESSDSSEDEKLVTKNHNGQHTIQGSRKRKAEHNEEKEVHSAKAKPPPPLPASFHSLYATNVRTSTADDPSLHLGRTRQVPHTVGNWPTHVYLEWYPSQPELALLDSAIQKASQTTEPAGASIKIHDFLRSDLGAQLPLHVSLSAPLVLKTEQKELFENKINARLAHSHLKPFTVYVTKLDWAANHDKTRFFLVLKLSTPKDNELNELLAICNATADYFDLPRLYDDAEDHSPGIQSHLQSKTAHEVPDQSHAFHISIAWTLEGPDNRGRTKLLDLADDQLTGLKVSFSLLKLKIGNNVIDLPLAQH